MLNERQKMVRQMARKFAQRELAPSAALRDRDASFPSDAFKKMAELELLGGIAAWYQGRIAVVGVEPEAAPTLAHALRAGRPVDAPAGGIAADSLAPRRIGEQVFPIVRHHVHSVVLVSDDAIFEAQQRLWEVLRIAVEPGGAAAAAALLSGRYRPRSGERIGLLLSGANTTAVDFNR